MAQLRSELSIHFSERQEQLFSDIPKLHAVLHSVLAAHYMNPKLSWYFRQKRQHELEQNAGKEFLQRFERPWGRNKNGGQAQDRDAP